ncbi:MULTISPECIES: hemin ABC transporter substrate-binding protein [unclassified Dyella]|uniref:heme/hemin ABC transporter substrate-binding protein n=1 Tax=unclassified Dyella TaxID=2634549 RepID=UPI000CAEBF7C|nr:MULTISPECIES: hemin ABC transporter substrate-binding protein [unclassified Dyella]MDR3447181.1 hemin ABC transporter substrate-binding protein [Dyella sp.]PMQ04669.1 Hemin-binding periplasmic protein HmuT [Dyella sp. AD56]
MHNHRLRVLGICLLGCMAWVVHAGDAPVRVVALGGDITEIVYALDAQNQLVGVDSTSLWPEAATKLPDVGYVRQLAAEGILSLHPQLILATHDAGPATVVTQLHDVGVRIVSMPVTRTPETVVAKVKQVGAALDRESAANALAAKLQARYADLFKAVAAMPRHPRVVFLMSAGEGSPKAAGKDTAADSAITLAGGVNAGQDFTGYKAVSPEALAKLAPDVILLMRERENDVGGVDGVLKLPGIAMTPAGRARRIVFVDGQALLGFGPRNAEHEQALQRTLVAVQP